MIHLPIRVPQSPRCFEFSSRSQLEWFIRQNGLVGILKDEPTGPSLSDLGNRSMHEHGLHVRQVS